MRKKPFAYTENGYYLFWRHLSIEGGVRNGGKVETREMIGRRGHAMLADVTPVKFHTRVSLPPGKNTPWAV